ncbi:hypothetical protein ACJX0J_038132, partial [Zea mays]
MTSSQETHPQPYIWHYSNTKWAQPTYPTLSDTTLSDYKLLRNFQVKTETDIVALTEHIIFAIFKTTHAAVDDNGFKNQCFLLDLRQNFQNLQILLNSRSKIGDTSINDLVQNELADDKYSIYLGLQSVYFYILTENTSYFIFPNNICCLIKKKRGGR